MTELNNDDVVSMDPQTHWVGTETFKVQRLLDKIRDRLGPEKTNQWLEGAPCEVLKTTGGGWRQGKLYIRFEFIPDEQPLSDEPGAE